MLTLDPSERITAKEALAHPFFDEELIFTDEYDDFFSEDIPLLKRNMGIMTIPIVGNQEEQKEIFDCTILSNRVKFNKKIAERD